jgi:ribosome-associated protein
VQEENEDRVEPGERVRVGHGLTVPSSALRWRFSRSSGAGGQHVNTTDSRVELLLDLDAAGLPERVDGRLRSRFGDVVRVVASDSRSQARNRRIAFDRLVTLLADAARTERPRRPTRPSAGAVEDRLTAKHRVAARKRDRRRPTQDE